ncbi:MAG: prepilin-type N-terminal cleavage/methylation domain-containing protein [Betaproteobacteria bacterium]|nr:MAG: prepilin-type N-terminal cleavage/methylation domain-containing protein [Betaproteobacteria bacterium]
MRERGFSLVEFMIAMTIGLFLIAGLVYLLAETSRSRAEIERSSRQIENGRYALDRIAEDLRHAGFYSEYYALPTSGKWNFPGSATLADACATAIGNPGVESPLTLPTGLFAGMPLGIQGYDGGASVPADLAACLSAADYLPDTDILVVRRASTSTVAKGVVDADASKAKQPYIQTTPFEYLLKTGASAAANFTLKHPSANSTLEVDAPLHRYLVRIYFVSKCNVPSNGNSDDDCDAAADGGTPSPTLKILELGLNKDGNTGFRKLAIAEGIEQLQFDYGIDDTPAAVNLATGYSGDGVADRIVTCTGVTCSTADWSSVVSVQVNLVARNTERSPDYSDDKTYVLGLAYPSGAPYTPAAGVRAYRRHAYSSIVRVKNIAMRRE